MFDLYNMEFSTNETPVAIVREVLFGKRFSRNIYPDVNGKWIRDIWRNLLVNNE